MGKTPSALLATLCVLPFVYFCTRTDGLIDLLHLWYVPLMATVAATIPASGAPVAGGILFLPVLQSYGVCPRDAVAFSSITQFFGCGIFAPLNWLAIDPNVFLQEALHVSLIPSVLGSFISLTWYKLHGCHGEHYVVAIFACFCGLLSIYVAHSLLCGRMPKPRTTDEKVVQIGRREACLWFLPCLSGGLLTGYIGISIEKVLYVLIMMSCDVPVRVATVTSITLVGWVSGFTFVLHALSPCDPLAPQYIGAVPYDLWLVALPGILLGSIIGPQLNALLGPNLILAAFAIALAYESIRNTLALMHRNAFAECVLTNAGSRCEPQHENMAIGHQVARFVPWLLSEEHAAYMRDLWSSSTDVRM